MADRQAEYPREQTEEKWPEASLRLEVPDPPTEQDEKQFYELEPAARDELNCHANLPK